MEEIGGFNLYAFVGANPENYIDPFGLYDISGNTVTVENCEIVILYGHSNPRKPWRFEFPAGPSAGAVVVCKPGRTNCKIPLKNKIPGAPEHDDEILWPSRIETDRARLEREESGLPDPTQELKDVIAGAKAKAKDMLKQCPKVNIRFHRATTPLLDRVIPPKPADIPITRPPAPKPQTPAPK